jgi:hypothetical protein
MRSSLSYPKGVLLSCLAVSSGARFCPQRRRADAGILAAGDVRLTVTIDGTPATTTPVTAIVN